MQMDCYNDENEHGLYTSYLHILKPHSKMNDDHDSKIVHKTHSITQKKVSDNKQDQDTWESDANLYKDTQPKLT